MLLGESLKPERTKNRIVLLEKATEEAGGGRPGEMSSRKLPATHIHGQSVEFCQTQMLACE